MKVLSLIDRNTGNSGSFVIDGLGFRDICPILDANISREAMLMTDDWATYRYIGWSFSKHATVNHSAGQYAVPG